MDSEDDRSRMTMVMTTSQDDELVEKTLVEIQNAENQTVYYVLSKFIQNPAIKNQPDFVTTLFEDHLGIVRELIDWALCPSSLVRHQKIKSDVAGYPYHSKEFMKDNWCFYEKLYLYVRNGQLPLELWFKFLQKQHYDPVTIDTALGYFSQILVPFAKYQFSASYDLMQALDPSGEGLGIFKVITPPILALILQYSHHTAIYQFFINAILLGIQDPLDTVEAENALVLFLETCKYEIAFPLRSRELNNRLAMVSESLQNISNALKETITNIDSSKFLSERLQSIIKSILRSHIIQFAVNAIIKGRLCTQGKNLSRANSVDGQKRLSLMLQQQPLMSISQPIYMQPWTTVEIHTDIEEQQDYLQLLMKILTYCVEIFVKVPKYVQKSMNVVNPRIMPEDHSNIKQYQDIVLQFQIQMQNLLDQLPIMTSLVYRPPNQSQCLNESKTLKFSSGQNIKPITFMKFQYFKLVHSCLLMVHCRNTEVSQWRDQLNQSQNSRDQREWNSKAIIDDESLQSDREDKNGSESDASNSQTIANQSHTNGNLSSMLLEPFVFDVEKINLLEVIEKYMIQNRWNNIAHRVLQKIFHLLVMKDSNYLHKKINKEKNKTEGLVCFLIENFTQRDYIFLDTFRFTTQGNLHSLYSISKDLAYTLNNTNHLVLLLNQFEPWKKFILNDLNKYQEKTYPVMTMPEPDQMEQDGHRQSFGVKVDQVDSIKKLIENISVTKKWPHRSPRFKAKGNSKSFIFRSNTLERENMSKSHEGNRTSNVFQVAKTLDELLKKKIELNNKGKSNQINEFEVEEISIRQKLAKQLSSYSNGRKVSDDEQ